MASESVTPLVASPITIGELTDVPAPNSPINSQFHQETANRIIHRFADATAMNAWAAANGSMAFVVNEGRHYVRRGGVWDRLVWWSEFNAASANAAAAAIGLITRVQQNADKTVTTAALITGCTVTFTADPTRYYRTRIQVPSFDSTGGGTGVFSIDDGATVLKTVHANSSTTPVKTHAELELIESGLSGSQTRRLIASIAQGSLTVYFGNGFTSAGISVEDIGNV